MSTNNCTVLYYTGSKESKCFEQNIIEDLLIKSKGLPIISVSQKPLKLGENICVGDVGHSYFNLFRQIYIGVKKVETPYVITSESDFIYSEDYFKPRELEEELYRFNNVWILFMANDRRERNIFYKKGFSDGCQVFKRDAFLDKAEKLFHGLPQWQTGITTIKHPLDRISPVLFTGAPCISFKTVEGLSQNTKTKNGMKKEVLAPYGEAKELIKKYVC